MPEFADVIHTLCRGNVDFSTRQITLAVLAYKHKDEPNARGCKELAKEMGVSKPAVTRAMDKLEEQEFGSRVRHPDDRRAIIFTLTKAGLKFVAPLVGTEAAADAGAVQPKRRKQ